MANNATAGPNGSREVQIEGLNAVGGLGFYGNCAASALFPSNCDDDDSGTVQYVSIRYGGFNLSANNEINGLTLGAVGRRTDIANVEVFGSPAPDPPERLVGGHADRNAADRNNLHSGKDGLFDRSGTFPSRRSSAKSLTCRHLRR